VPALAHYVTGWPRPGDFGTVAVAGEDVAGVAWARLFPDDDPGYGFVAADVPELTIAVRPGHRGRGLGGTLLDAVLAQARARGLRAVSLSVEDGNRARRLYERAGFVVVGRSGTSDTMLLELT
jgi:ribosomal protein S18 acetylase RimI-like enzyme